MYCDYDMYRHQLGLHPNHFYESSGRNGDQLKKRPELEQLNLLTKDIASFSKLLGIVVVKDTKMKKTDDGEEWK